MNYLHEQHAKSAKIPNVGQVIISWFILLAVKLINVAWSDDFFTHSSLNSLLYLRFAFGSFFCELRISHTITWLLPACSSTCSFAFLALTRLIRQQGRSID